MPSTVNGIGTWYHFKKNAQSYRGVCRACKRNAVLTSYDATLCFVILFIPIVPLGKKRIVDECGSCRRHAVLTHDAWVAARDRVAATVAAYRASPQDPAKAKEALLAVVGLRDIPAFGPLSDDIARELAWDPESLRLLAEGCEVMGQYERIEKVLRLAAEVDETDASRETLAMCLMNQGKVDEAAGLLQHIIDEGIPDRVNLVFVLGQMYQSKGQHDRALEAFENCERINPAIAEDKSFAKLKAESVKRLGTSKPVPLGAVRKREASGRSKRKAAVVVGGILLAVAGIYAITSVVEGMYREVYLVNGLGHEYTARINGTDYRLAAHGTKSIRVSEGDIRVGIVDAPPGVDERTVKVQTAFLTRPLGKETYVINPDETAHLRVVRAFYGARVANLPPTSAVKHVAGECLSVYDKLHLVFEPFPDSIKLSKQSDDEFRDRLELVVARGLIEDMNDLEEVREKVGKEALAHAVLRRMELEPDAEQIADLAQDLSSPEEFLKAVRTGLAVKPVRISWHRAYQQAMSKAGKDDEAAAEYAKMLAADPTDATMMYLAGRASPDPATTMGLYLKSAASPKAPALVFYSLAFLASAHGENSEAADWAEKLLAASKNADRMRLYTREMYLCAGRWRSAIDLAESDMHGPLQDKVNALQDQAYALAMQAKDLEALAVLGRAESEIAALDKDGARDWGRRQRAELEYVLGRPGDLIAELKRQDKPAERALGAIMAGDARDGDAQIKAVGEHSLEADLMMYMTARMATEPEIAQRYWDAAVRRLGEGERGYRQAGAALRSGRSSKALMEVAMPRSEKVLVMAAYMLKYPAQAGEVINVVRKMNCDHRSPYLLINRTLDWAQGRGVGK